MPPAGAIPLYCWNKPISRRAPPAEALNWSTEEYGTLHRETSVWSAKPCMNGDSCLRMPHIWLKSRRSSFHVTAGGIRSNTWQVLRSTIGFLTEAVWARHDG